jgi:hypothetical protein
LASSATSVGFSSLERLFFAMASSSLPPQLDIKFTSTRFYLKHVQIVKSKNLPRFQSWAVIRENPIEFGYRLPARQ